ncbi:MAG: YihY/virulence factor BrkB family protein [Clostridia bacterium]|nr:YihY/virulence factor BrkB family protein [Clostridia bacterium]
MNLLNVIIRKAKTFINAVIKDNISTYASQASFFIIISAIPFIMLLLTLLKFFVPMDQMTILSAINRLAPETIGNFLTTIVNELFNKTASAPIISVTAFTTLWLASKGVMALYLGLNNVFKPEKMPNYFYCRFISVLYTLIFIASLLLTIVVFGFGSKIEDIMLENFGFLSKILSYIINAKILIFTIILTLCFALFYKFLPRRNNSFKYQLPGALCASAGWMLFSYFYSIYIEMFSNYSYVYGSLTALVFLMLWLYFCMNIFLYGAEINKLYEERFQKKY